MIGTIYGVAAAKGISFVVNPVPCEIAPSAFDAQECVALEAAPVIVVSLGLKLELSLACVPVFG